MKYFAASLKNFSTNTEEFLRGEGSSQAHAMANMPVQKSREDSSLSMSRRD
jgi:hypothetical protein